jgi:drug/metabolite transporter (DMT)-like permease
MIGTFLLVVNGRTLSLHVTLLGLIFGTLCAVGAAFYTLYSKKLTNLYGSWTITTWGFIIAGIVSLPIGSFSLFQERFTLTILFLVLFVTIFGTILAYGLYVKSLEQLTGTEASITATGEPIMASIASYFLLGVLLSPFQYLGGALILIAIFFLRSVIRSPKEK